MLGDKTLPVLLSMLSLNHTSPLLPTLLNKGRKYSDTFQYGKENSKGTILALSLFDLLWLINAVDTVLFAPIFRPELSGIFSSSTPSKC